MRSIRMRVGNCLSVSSGTCFFMVVCSRLVLKRRMVSPYAITAFLKFSMVLRKVYAGMNAALFVSTSAYSRQKRSKAWRAKAQASVDIMLPCLVLDMLKTMASRLMRSGLSFSTSLMNFSTMFQYGLIIRHSMRCNILSLHLHPILQFWSSNVGSLFLTKMARWSILRQFFSSVASDSGVPSVGQMISKGIVRPIASGQLVSQLGRLSLMMLRVKSLVRRLMVRWGSLVIA